MDLVKLTRNNKDKWTEDQDIKLIDAVLDLYKMDIKNKIIWNLISNIISTNDSKKNKYQCQRRWEVLQQMNKPIFDSIALSPSKGK